MVALAFIIPFIAPLTDSQSYFKYCIDLVTRPLLTATAFIISAAVFFFLIKYISFLIPAVFKNKNQFHFSSWEFLSRLENNLAKNLKEFIFFGLPPILALSATANIMAHLSSLNVDRLIDGKVAAWDKAIIGGYPFSSLVNVIYPEWLVAAVKYSFVYLPTLIVLFALYIFLYHRGVFREIASVFCLSLIFLIAAWQFFPVLSPQDRFIDNVYNLPNPPDFVQASVSRYAPQASILSFLHEVRLDKKELGGVMPTSTLPSAHVVWAIFFVYYTYRSRKIFLFATIPLAFFSSIGTVLFAQHYFVDIPSAILLAIFCIFLIRYLKRTNLASK